MIYRVENIWVRGFNIYCQFNDGTWVLDLRKYSQASYPRVQYLIKNPAALANVELDDNNCPIWPNGFELDPDVFREEGVLVTDVNKAASSLTKGEFSTEEVTKSLDTLGVDYIVTGGRISIKVSDVEKVLSHLYPALK